MDGSLCFASMRFQRRQINLPYLESNLQSLKREIRQDTLPKVRYTAQALPNDVPGVWKGGRPYISVKSVLAVVMMVTSGMGFWQSVLPPRSTQCFAV
jgi:hypothetical protein